VALSRISDALICPELSVELTGSSSMLFSDYAPCHSDPNFVYLIFVFSVWKQTHFQWYLTSGNDSDLWTEWLSLSSCLTQRPAHALNLSYITDLAGR